MLKKPADDIMKRTSQVSNEIQIIHAIIRFQRKARLASS